MQKKTFTKWVNSHLSRVSCRITDLYMDLRDGRMLIKLLEVLSGERLVGAFILKQEAEFWLLGPVLCGQSNFSYLLFEHVYDPCNH